jgi:hypothetical protein
MFQKDFLFYAANVEPEVARMFAAFDHGQKDVADKFKLRTVKMIDEILARKEEVSSAGREEWFCIRNLVEGYDHLDAYSRRVLLGFGVPFSQKFMNRLA